MFFGYYLSVLLVENSAISLEGVATDPHGRTDPEDRVDVRSGAAGAAIDVADIAHQGGAGFGGDGGDVACYKSVVGGGDDGGHILVCLRVELLSLFYITKL